MRIPVLRYICVSLLTLVGVFGGSHRVDAQQKSASFKLYMLSLQFGESSVYNYGGNIQQWKFTTAGSTNQPLGYTNGALSAEVSPTTRNFSSGSNTFRSDFIIYDYTLGYTRTAYGLFSMVLPTQDRSGQGGVPDGVPDLFQPELGFQHWAKATASERYNQGGNPRSGTVDVYLSREQGNSTGAYQLRYGSTNNPVIVNGQMRALSASGTVFYNPATRIVRFDFDNGLSASSTYTNSGSNVTIPAFTLPASTTPDYQVKNLYLSRVGKTYRAIWEFVDGNTANSYRDIPYNYLVITDNNDTDGDTIPDLSDPFVAPTIKVQPQSKTVMSGSSVTFTANASGYPYVSYQWQKNGNPIAGATTSALTLNKVQVSQAGNYRLVASNPAGTAYSDPAQLVVCDYSFSPSVPTFDSAGGSTNVAVNVSAGCDWFVLNTNAWLQIGNGNGSGSAMFTLTAAANTNEGPRLGFLKVGNRWLPIRQMGQLPPPSLSGKTLLMTTTDATGELASDTQARLWSSAATNSYLAAATFSSTPLDQGTYIYQRTTASSATLSLSDVSGEFTVQLEFAAPGAGEFLLTAPSGDTQSGTFVLNVNRADFNADHREDLLSQNLNRVLFSSFMSGTNLLGKARLRNGIAPGTGWRVFGSADINRDDHADVLLQHDTGKMNVWFMNQTNLIGSAALRTAATGWRAVATADFNGDDAPDILFEHTTRKAAVWYMQGTNFISSALIRNGVAAATGWKIVGVGDFSDDGQQDVLWQHDDGRLAPWHLIGPDFLNSSLLRNGQTLNGWRVVSLNDFNGDGKGDLLFQNGSKLVVWSMNASTFLNSAPLASSTVTGTVLGPR